MFRRDSINFALFSLILDLGLTLVSIIIALAIRPSITGLPGMVTYHRLSFDPILYLILPTIWLITFLSFSVYDPKKRYRVTEEIQQLLLAIGFATLVFAGVLYFGFREVSHSVR